MALLVEVIDGGVDGALEMVEIAKGLMGEEMRFRSRQACSIAFSSGAYFGSHSTLSQGLASRAAREALLVWIGTVVEDEHDRLRLLAGTWAVEFVEPPQQGDDVAAFFGPAGVDDEVAGRRSPCRSSCRPSAIRAIPPNP